MNFQAIGLEHWGDKEGLFERICRALCREGGYLVDRLEYSKDEVSIFKLRHGELQEFAFAPVSHCPIRGKYYPRLEKGRCVYYNADDSGCSVIIWSEHQNMKTDEFSLDIQKAVDAGEVPSSEQLRRLSRGLLAEQLGVEELFPVFVVIYTVSELVTKLRLLS